ncbi:MAG: N-acetyl-gamma-glutamyl-phosphate reductase [Thermodesulfobacteriota bacterium]
MKIGILGATGYTGVELLRLLASHKGVQISWLTSEKFAGESISDVFPHFKDILDIKCYSVRNLSELEQVDLVFSCLPHGTSKHFVNKMLDKGSRVIDFSSDFRSSNKSAYGLPEINNDQIMEAKLVANPGCYATSVILGLAPLAHEGLLSKDSIVADIKSGLSGAGRAPSLEHHFSESNEGISLGSASAQNQETEMEEQLYLLNQSKVHVSFMPHNVSIDRGILATIYTRLNKKTSTQQAHKIYNEYFSDKKFVRVLGLGEYPSTKNVRFSNMCDIGIGNREGLFIVVVALDNLGKGASGQAVQNMNLMFDFPETKGLMSSPIYP